MGNVLHTQTAFVTHLMLFQDVDSVILLSKQTNPKPQPKSQHPNTRNTAPTTTKGRDKVERPYSHQCEGDHQHT